MHTLMLIQAACMKVYSSDMDMQSLGNWHCITHITNYDVYPTMHKYCFHTYVLFLTTDCRNNNSGSKENLLTQCKATNANLYHES